MYPREYRMLVVKLLDSGLTYEQVCVDGLARKTAREWYNRWQETGRVDPKPIGGNNPRKMTPWHDEQLRRWLEAEPELFYRELRERFEHGADVPEDKRVRVADGTIWEAMKRIGWTRKKRRSTTRDETPR